MKIYLDNNLGVTKVEQEELTQDTIGYNILKVYIPNAVLTPYDTFTCYYGALLQNGRKVGWFAMEARTSTDADYEANYTLYKATLEQCVVSVEGKVYIGCQVLLGNSGNATLIKKNTAVVQFNVRKSVAINNDILILDTDQTTTDVLESYKNLLKNALTTYATKATTYTKTEVNSALALKADKSDTYNKTEVDVKDLNLAAQMASDKVELNNRINTTNGILTATQAEVANLKSVQNVVEVVATKSALNSYDTTKLDVNDKIQVIADESHDGASTIYNWNGSAWQYVGAYGTNSYTKQESDNKFAPKTTAITHTGNQLQDYSGNNVYPNLNDGQITRNKEKYYQIEVNSLLNDEIFSLDKRLNYGWSGTLQDWATYSDGRYTYMWIEIEYNKRYWGNPLAVWLFNSSQEYIATLDGIANVFKNFDIPDNSNIYYACIMYPAVTTNPIFRKTSVEIQDKIYDNGLFLKPNNFNIYTKCHRIQSFDEIVDFSGATTSTGVVAIDDNKTYFSRNAKLCYATKTSGVSSYTVTKTARIENWKSMTFVFYIPYETWLGSTANSGYIQGYINGNVNYGWYFNGRYKWGWNFIKIRKSDIANAPTNVTSITITLNPRGSVSNGDNFGYITLDSVIFNMKMKPCVLLNFDHIYQESIDNGGYDLLFNNHIKFTLFTHGFTSLNANYKEIARKFIDELNCEIGSYGGANSNNTIINGDSYTLLQKYNDLMSLRSEFSEVFYGENYSYATSQAKLTPKVENAIMQSGFKYIRALSGLPMTYFDNNCNWIVHIEFSTLTYNQIKKLIDAAIEYGDCLPLFTHGIANDTDSQISSTSIPLSIMTQVVDYLHTKISNGEIECLTFDEFYHSCID